MLVWLQPQPPPYLTVRSYLYCIDILSPPCFLSTSMYKRMQQLTTTSTQAPGDTSWRFRRRRTTMTSPSRPIVGFRRSVGGRHPLCADLSRAIWILTVLGRVCLFHDDVM